MHACMHYVWPAPLPLFQSLVTAGMVLHAVTPHLPELATSGAAGVQQGIALAAQVGAVGIPKSVSTYMWRGEHKHGFVVYASGSAA